MLTAQEAIIRESEGGGSIKARRCVFIGYFVCMKVMLSQTAKPPICLELTLKDVKGKQVKRAFFLFFLTEQAVLCIPSQCILCSRRGEEDRTTPGRKAERAPPIQHET